MHLLALLPLLFASVPPTSGPAAPLRPPTAPDTVRDLTALLDTGRIVQDRNGDGLVDFVDVRIVLPDDADAAEVAAAANVAARLAFESSATDLGLATAGSPPAGSPATPVVVVGDRTGLPDRAGVGRAALRAGLAPGQGALVHLPVGAGLPRGGVAVVGADATGLLAASAYLSGRFPAVWDVDGAPWDTVTAGLRAFVEGPDAAVDEVVLRRIVVDAGRPGVARAEAVVRVADPVGFAAVLAALRQVEPSDGDESGGTAGPAEEAGPAETGDPAEEGDPAGEGDPTEETDPAGTGAPDDADPPDRSDLLDRHLRRLDVRVEGPDSAVVVRIVPDEPRTTPAGPRAPGGAGDAFTLSRLYEVGGLYRDTNQDLVPDETAVTLAVEAGPVGAGVAAGVVDLATRIGLETAGARFPLAAVTGEDVEPAGAGLPVVVGAGSFPLRRLLEEERLPGWDASPGVGTVRMVPDGPTGDPVLLVAGGDDAGTAAALSWLAGRAPWLWTPGKGEYRLADAETAFRRFVQAREAPGQAALALHKLATWVDRLAGDRRLDGGTVGDPAGAPVEGGPPGTDPGARGDPGTTARAVDSVTVELAVEEAPPGLADVARDVVLERLPGADVAVRTYSTGFGVGDTVYHRSFDFGWEVDDVRAALAADVYPAVRAGRPGRVEVRVSEPPGVRGALAEEIRAELAGRGASPVEVTVLSAYKQGFSWIEDTVLPRLREIAGDESERGVGNPPPGESSEAGVGNPPANPIGRIRITYHTLDESDEIRWQAVAADTRWLQEIYPADAVLARELGVPVDSITFHATRRAEPIYTLTATGPGGDTLLADAFHPKYVVRPFFDLFPEYERVRVTTGWVTATAAGDTLVDRRVVTDPERFWDALQTDVYGRIVEYVMDIQDGEPSGSHAPYFDELTVRLRMSEPDRRIGIDEEVVSALEALHEDVYFETLTLFDLIGNRYGVGGLSYPGRVLPYVDPTGAGKPATATVTLTGKERGVPELVVTASRGPGRAASSGAVGGGAGTTTRPPGPSAAAPAEEPERREYALAPLPLPEPPLRAVSVRAEGPADRAGGGDPGGGTASPGPLDALLFEVEVVDSLDRFDEFRERSSEAAIDRTFLSAGLVEGMLAALRRLHRAGLYTEALSWDRIGRTDVLLRVEDDSTWARTASVSRSGAPLSTDNPELLARGWEWRGERMVQWESPIPPAENDTILARLNTFPGVDVHYLTRSFLGQPVWAADFLPPQPAAYVSQAKLNALKPTLFISGRQHANEVSSTSHILRLGELLATDSTYRSRLDRVNVVLHPVTNPDGARLAVEMQETNPDFMLHAGYLGALGVDATAGELSDDPTYPESQARRRLRETWLPDVYVNMHGYPSHEWVQYFAGYSAWVRSRRGGARDWWAPRGWFIPGFRWVDDDEHPEYTDAQFAMLDSIASSIRALPDVAAMSDRLYARYRKYGVEDREGFREHFRNGVLMYLSLRGADDIGQGVYSPRITYMATTTEAPDETARGDWLELVASAGLAHATALLEYLAEGDFEVEREAEAYDGAVTRKVYRVKPVLPPEPDDSTAPEANGAEGDAARRPGGPAPPLPHPPKRKLIPAPRM